MNRIYAEKDVTNFTLSDVKEFIEKEGIDYSGDYGFEVKDTTELIYSEN